MKAALLILAAAVFLGAAVHRGSGSFQPPRGWPTPVYDFSANPLREDKRELGRQLFYDPILSADSTISCASCHSPYNAFAHTDHALSHGIGDRQGTRNAPALLNLAWQKEFHWDGAINHLDLQPLAPLTHSAEMGETLPHVLEKLRRSPHYRKQFGKLYHREPASSDVLKSISQFLLSLQSSGSKYDSVRTGTARFSGQEQAGYALFRSKCASCHTEPLFSNFAYAHHGDTLSTGDAGRAGVTGLAKDLGLYKTPTLRNLEYTYPYLHDGRYKSLREVLSAMSANFIPLSGREQSDLIAFLLTLSDPGFVFDPRHRAPPLGYNTKP